MHKILITGGSGTVGSAFLRRYSGVYQFGIVSRNEKLQYEIKKDFPDVSLFLGSVEDRESLFRVFDAFHPDVVIHAAAMKHVDMAERQPIQTTRINVVGSLNVIDASIRFDVPITIAISTDKACEHQNIYGVSKFLMEQCFLEANSKEHKFAVCRFGNVAHSNGSVIPFWLKLKQEGKPLRLTCPEMNRLMFLPKEAAELIYRAIEECSIDGGFILSKMMKTVNMLRLAKSISGDIEIVGSRPGEKIDEDLISDKELPYSEVVERKYIKIWRAINSVVSSRLPCPYSTLTAEVMTDEELSLLINGGPNAA